ncbi:hypothetical protein CBOM_05287 [Ceraceosorus bombacis]|uniref:Uncharacterized protein n=1 Tax=Ceraceosorus bombacis TaxID=401625 RepID=A0A0P1BQ48_9BASI|nr:hypothetical protein CBOM_05287 [Ceraceosorus bombacis]
MATTLVALVGTCVALSAALVQTSILSDPAKPLRAVFSACTNPRRASLSTDFTLGNFKPADDALCLALTYFKTLLSDGPGIGAASLLASVLIPILFRLTYISVSPNNRTVLRGIALPIGFLLGGIAFGFGTFLSSVGSLVYIAGLYIQVTSPKSSLPLLPSPAPAVYAANLANMIFIAILISMALFDVAGQNWLNATTAFCLSPLVVYFPLLFLGVRETVVPKTEEEARKELASYNAAEVSYCYERTWAYQRQVSLLSSTLYWYGLNRIVMDLIFLKSALSYAAHFMLYQFFGTVWFLFLIRVAEHLTTRSVSPVHPITGHPRSDVQKECSIAIAAAPAGHPATETGLLGNNLVAILAGPGTAMSLWWAHGEERDGWLARRAWRETQAVGAKAVADSKAATDGQHAKRE